MSALVAAAFVASLALTAPHRHSGAAKPNPEPVRFSDRVKDTDPGSSLRAVRDDPARLAPPGERVEISSLPGWSLDDQRVAFEAFRASCAALLAGTPPTRPALPPPPSLSAVCVDASRLSPADATKARRFFETRFEPRRVAPDAFFTGYYEPIVDGYLSRTAPFRTPLYPTPPDLVAIAPGQPPPGIDPALTTARRLPDGRYEPLPDRAAIEAGALRMPPLVYVRDPVEAFFIQIQGSARIRLPDGSLRRLAYAGRNGYPYTSIGKLLAQRLKTPPDQMGLAHLKAWIRANGEGPGDAGTRLMQENRSYIFFRFDDSLPAAAGPIGGEGVSIAALRALAIDRTRWPYGLPFWVDVDLPWASAKATPLRRLMVGQDTGAAIIGPARADIFFGTGAEAALRAGTTRAHGALFVLWPKDTAENHKGAAP